MKIYLSAGSAADNLISTLKGSGIVVCGYSKTLKEAFESLGSESYEFDKILITDHSIESVEELYQTLTSLKELFTYIFTEQEIKFITKEDAHYKVFIEVFGEPDRRFHCILVESQTPAVIFQFCTNEPFSNPGNIKKDSLGSLYKQEQEQQLKEAASDKPDLGAQIGSMVKQKIAKISKPAPKPQKQPQKEEEIAEQPEEQITNEEYEESKKIISSAPIRKGVIVVTGDRCTGKTSTVVNLAEVLAEANNTVLVIDSDVERKSFNQYYHKFFEELKIDTDKERGLLNCLKHPERYADYVSRVKGNIDALGLLYGVSTNDKGYTNFTPNDFRDMLSILESVYDYIIVDMPLDILERMYDCIPCFSKILLCCSNTQLSIFNTIIAVESAVQGKRSTLFCSKAGLVITNMNKKVTYGSAPLSGDVVKTLLGTFSSIPLDVDVLGTIPSTSSFDKQLSSGKRISSVSADYHKAYSEIISNL